MFYKNFHFRVVFTDHEADELAIGSLWVFQKGSLILNMPEHTVKREVLAIIVYGDVLPKWTTLLKGKKITNLGSHFQQKDR